MFQRVKTSASQQGCATRSTHFARNIVPSAPHKAELSRIAPRSLSPRTKASALRSPSSLRWPQCSYVPHYTERRNFSKMAESQSWWHGSDTPPPTDDEAKAFESKPMDVPEETGADAEALRTRRVHILGLGSIGTLIAHSLRCLPNPPPISLLMHRPEMYEQFKKEGRTIRLVNKMTEVNNEEEGFDADVQRDQEGSEVPYWTHIADYLPGTKEPRHPIQEGERLESGETYIYTIIVTVKGPATVGALASIKHRVNAESTICLMQNGMGQVDELNEHVFTDPATRPTYMLGIISHGAYMSSNARFAVNHAGLGTTSLGIYRDTDKYPLPPKSSILNLDELSIEDRKRMYPSDKDLYANLSSRYLLRTLTRSPVLACAAFPYLDLLQLQLEKLVMNAVLNPLTALLNVPNGMMLDNSALTKAQRLLLAEISLTLRSLPELEGVPGAKRRFSASRLETLFLSVSQKTARNSSSMREDVRNGKPTEIQYINGYIVKRGQELGIKCVLNYLIMQLIEGKTYITRDDSITPYGVSSIQADAQDGQQSSDNVVSLEDSGTQFRDKAY